MRSYSGYVVRGCFVLTAAAAPPHDCGEADERAYYVDRIEWDLRPARTSELVTLSESSHDGITTHPPAMLATWHFVLNSNARRSGPAS